MLILPRLPGWRLLRRDFPDMPGIISKHLSRLASLSLWGVASKESGERQAMKAAALLVQCLENEGVGRKKVSGTIS